MLSKSVNLGSPQSKIIIKPISTNINIRPIRKYVDTEIDLKEKEEVKKYKAKKKKEEEIAKIERIRKRAQSKSSIASMHSTQKLNNKSSHILEPVLDQYRKANSDHNSDISDTQYNHTQIPLQNHNTPD